jgi:hypothetical protein
LRLKGGPGPGCAGSVHPATPLCRGVCPPPAKCTCKLPADFRFPTAGQIWLPLWQGKRITSVSQCHFLFECGRRATVEKALRAWKHSKCSSITISYVCHAPAQPLRSLDFAWNRTCDSMTCSRSSKKASGDGLVRFSFADGERQRHRRNGRHPKSATRDERRVARRGGQDASGAHRSASPRLTNGAAIRRYCIIG